jgi:hypothetical protein
MALVLSPSPLFAGFRKASAWLGFAQAAQPGRLRQAIQFGGPLAMVFCYPSDPGLAGNTGIYF